MGTCVTSLIELFNQTCREDYKEIEPQFTTLEQAVDAAKPEDKAHLHSMLDKLHRQYADIKFRHGSS